MEKKVNIAVFCYSSGIPQIINFHGFENYKSEGDIEDEFTSLALTSLVPLSRGNSYIEGSVILPVGENMDQTGLSACTWVNDSNQKDDRIEGKCFASVLIIVPRRLDWLLGARKIWENRLIGFLKSQDDISLIKIEELKDLVLDTMIDISLTKSG